ncbi:MAG: TVP38/TMEM64 family protein [Candidatus Nomurabacteria bacterium]|nr:TVP38/TMEM64 family protein [Candidatus Nomurabacteria bacterium]USN87288.1 MAG: TVP38/TMEM64 family protein [Candidatus Nomurabacteria bacterium]
MHDKHSDLIGLGIVVILFGLALYVSQSFGAELGAYLNFGFSGMFIYVLLGIIATVAAPITTVPLIPIATSLWGAFITGLLSVVAWTIGAIIAFMLARRFGRPILSKYIDLSKISRYEKIFGDEQIFWQIVILRMMIPVDILSYAIGLFSTVKLSTYTAATIIGISPFAFILAYMPNMDLTIQIYVGIFIAIVAYLGYRKFNRK